ncbi:MAG: O-antigen ligase family protein [Methylococcales bacterium]
MNHIHKVYLSIVFSIVVLYSSYAYLYFFNSGFTSFKPLYWHFITIGVAIGFVVSKKPLSIPAISPALWLWLWLFLCNTIICFFNSNQVLFETQALIDNFEMMILFYSFIIIFQIKGAIHTVRLALLCVVMFSVAMNFIDFFYASMSAVPGRAAGLYQNPNAAGLNMIMAMLVSMSLVPKKLRLLVCLTIGAGVFLTFSRGAWLSWVIALTGLATIGYLDLGRKGFSIIFISTLAGFIVFSALTGGLIDILITYGFDSYLKPGTLARLGGSGSAFSDYSYMSRVQAASNALSVFADKPWFGAGLAVDKYWEVGAHNTYLRMAAEGGIIRLSLFVILIVILWQLTDNVGKVVLIIYALTGFTSHDHLRQPSLFIILALMVVVSKKSNEISRSNQINYEIGKSCR